MADFFYSDRESEHQKSHYNMLRSILYDILNQKESFFFHFQLEHREYQKLLREHSHPDPVEWHYKSLKNILLSLRDHPRAERLYLIIDAVDESNDKDRRNILQLLFDLCSEPKDCVVKVFVASRPVVELEYRISDKHNFIRLQDETKPDISNFAHSFLKQNFTGFLDRATEYIVEHAQGVFLWVRLVKEELLHCAEVGSTEKERFDFIKSLPTELEGFYEHILDKLERQGQEPHIRDGMRMFQLVLFARRPITAEELCHALGIPDNPDTQFIPSDENFQLNDAIERRIIYCGGNFLEIRQHDGTVASHKEPSNSLANKVLGKKTVQVMHQTVREFFIRSDGCVASSKFRVSEKDAHISISITCIRYLMLCAANTALASRLPNAKSWTSEHFEAYAQYLNERPLTNYALCYLKQHIDGCHQASNVSYFISQFIDVLTGNPAAYLLGSWVGSHLNKPLPDGELGRAAEDFRNKVLHAAVRMRFSRVAELLLIAGAQVEARLQGKTPLMVSAEGGDDTTVQLLLGANANINSKDEDSYGGTALHWAAKNGHEAVVKQLLEAKCYDPDVDNYGRTALHWAAKNGHEAVVQLLLEIVGNAGVRDTDKDGSKALHWAARSGHEEVVRLLLEANADVNAEDNDGWTALHWAAKNRHEEVVRLLLEDKANVNAKDNDGWAALHWAAKNGHEAVVQLLLKAKADVNARDRADNKRTALHWAAKNGHETIVQLLLKAKADVNAEDENGLRVLHLAAKYGHEGVVRLLVKAKVNVNAKYRNKSTALQLAAKNGHEAVVQLLLTSSRPPY
jgi:ankyrin repeat domain-containing protein 50